MVGIQYKLYSTSYHIIYIVLTLKINTFIIRLYIEQLSRPKLKIL